MQADSSTYLKLLVQNETVADDMRQILHNCLDEFSYLAGKRLLITGGSGFIGRYLVESIVVFNHENPVSPCRVLLPTRSLSGIEKKSPHLMGLNCIEWFEWDGKAIEQEPVDFVIHAASPVEPEEYLSNAYEAMQQMVGMTHAVLSFCKKSSVSKMLYLSSGAVYGAQSQAVESMDERYAGLINADDSRACYAESKRYCEMLCRLSSVPVVISRLFSCVGPYLDLNSSFAFSSFIRSADSGGEIVLHSDGSAERTYCYASDLTVYLWKLLVLGVPGQVYNVGSSAPVVTVASLAEKIALALDATVVKGDDNSNGDRQRYIPDTGKAEEFYTAQVGFCEAVNRSLKALYELSEIVTEPKKLHGEIDESV